MKRFHDRHHAGKLLAEHLERHLHDPAPIVLALPRGGVPVAYEIAVALHAPLDIFMVRKLGCPSQPELAMGAVASGGLRILNQDVVDTLDIPESTIDQIARRELAELQRREEIYRPARPPAASVSIPGRTVIVVDDGLATGSSMRAAALTLRQQSPARLIIAVPVAPPSACRDLARCADEIVCLCAPELFYAVGAWYEDFDQTTDAEVKDLLLQAQQVPASLNR